MSPEQRRLILGDAGMALVEKDSQTDRPPSPAQIARLRAIFATTGRNTSRSHLARTAA